MGVIADVGEWGRTNLGNIIKFAWLEEEPGIKAKNKVVLIDLMEKTVDCFYYFKKDEFIVNHNKDITKLLEKGDFVNGRMVIALKGEKHLSEIRDENDVVYTDYLDDWGEWVGLNTSEIKTILTHEKYEMNCYRLED